jgi:hypothetical protein
MADLDTAAKRISGANIGSPWRGLGYFPTGTVDGPERLAFAFMYSGITASAPGAVFPDPADVRTGITYGPTGADYTGTFAGGGGSYMRRR